MTRRGLVTVVAALLVVIGGAYAASGQMGAVRGHASSVRASEGLTAGDETTGDETTEDETTDDEPDGASPKEPCTLTSPPNRAAGASTADRHPGWNRGHHFGWCVAATHHATSGRPAAPGARAEKHGGKPGAKPLKKAHPGKGHGKRH